MSLVHHSCLWWLYSLLSPCKKDNLPSGKGWEGSVGQWRVLGFVESSVGINKWLINPLFCDPFRSVLAPTKLGKAFLLTSLLLVKRPKWLEHWMEGLKLRREKQAVCSFCSGEMARESDNIFHWFLWKTQSTCRFCSVVAERVVFVKPWMSCNNHGKRTARYELRPSRAKSAQLPCRFFLNRDWNLGFIEKVRAWNFWCEQNFSLKRATDLFSGFCCGWDAAVDVRCSARTECF